MYNYLDPKLKINYYHFHPNPCHWVFFSFHFHHILLKVEILDSWLIFTFYCNNIVMQN
jgi:hypothetical protein